MTPLLLTLAICTCPVEDVVPFHCDAVDQNRYFSDPGPPTFTQLVWLTWNGERHDINSSRIQKPGMEPIKVGKFYVVLFLDGDVMRKVYARSRLRSWGTVDYELEERTVLPPCKRRGLGEQ